MKIPAGQTNMAEMGDIALKTVARTIETIYSNKIDNYSKVNAYRSLGLN